MEEKRRDGGATPNSAGGSGDLPSDSASTRRRGGALKRKASAASASSFSSTPSKRFAREKSILMSQTPIHNGPLTRARHAPSNLATAMSGSALQAKPEGDNVFGKARDGAKLSEAEMMDKANEEWEALEAKIEAEFEAIRSRDSNAHVVPNHCGWFSWTKVHPIEERSLPSFFNGKHEGRSPDVYMRIRNWIMKKFHTNPNNQIELKDLSELEAGDVDSKQEVMEFLEYWGLINFHPFPPIESPSISLNGSKVEERETLVDKLYHFEAIQSCPTLAARPHLMTQATPSRLFSESAVSDESLKQEGPAVEYHCNSCSADCSRKRYHCQKQADFDLCTDCFNNEKFDPNMSSSDFILMEPAEAPGVGSGKWTDQETLLLLEALELYNENWSEIAEHVATKSKAQCILHFVQMPIEDAFLDCGAQDPIPNETVDPAATNDNKSNPRNIAESTERKNGTGDAQSSASMMETSKPEDANDMKSSQEAPVSEDDASEPKIDNKTPEPNSTGEAKCGNGTDNIALKAFKDAFEDTGYPLTSDSPLSLADAGNPVMALAAFLARLVGSSVATASVHASAKSIVGDSPGLQLAARHCFLLDDPLDDDKESTAASRSQCAKEDEKTGEGGQREASGMCERYLSNARDFKDEVPEEKKSLCSPADKSNAKADATAQPGKLGTVNEVDTSGPKDPGDVEMVRDSGLDDIKINSGEEANSSSDGASVKKIDHAQVTVSESAHDAYGPAEGSRDPKMADLLPAEKNETKRPVGATGENNALPKAASKDAVVEPDTTTAEHCITSATVSENGAAVKEENEDGNKVHVPVGPKDEHIEKIKRAAVSALTAAAVKAKLLAKQEEDQIRQLAVSLIEKQLYKLESKLGFFNEMDSVLIRVREQLERSKQRLFHERTQIIATRLGHAPMSSKALGQTNRIAANFANSVPRPPMWMTSLRPLMPRPMGPPAATSMPLASTVGVGTSSQPSGADKAPSVGSK